MDISESQRLSRLDQALKDTHVDLRGALVGLHNLSESLRVLRMQVELLQRIRLAELEEEHKRKKLMGDRRKSV